MIQNYRDFKEHFRADVNSMGRSTGVKSFLFHPVYRFVYLLRWNEYLLNSNKSRLIRAMPLLWFKRLSIKLGFSIPLNTCDQGLAIVHYGLLIINPRARIGKNCRIHAGVNIGGSAGLVNNLDESKQYAPYIGDNCYLGPGAKIFGPISIANGCVIGANAVVNKSFEIEDQTIGGIPAKIIADRGSKGLINIGTTT